MEDITEEIHRSASLAGQNKAATAEENGELSGGGVSGLIKLIASHLPGLPEKPTKPSAGEALDEEVGGAEAREEPAFGEETEPETTHPPPAASPDDFRLDTEEATILISIVQD